MAKTIIMTEGNPSKLLLQFAMPVIVGNMFQQIYSLADRAIVGKFVGDHAFAAIGSTTAPINMFASLCIGLCVGAGVAVAQHFGTKNKENTAKAIINSIYINLLMTLAASVIGVLGTKTLLEILNTPESLMQDAVSYMKIYIGGLPAVASYFTPFSILRSLGDTKTPLYFLIFAAVLNIVLDLIFVIPLQMGVAGAAIATVMAQCISAVLCILYAYKKHEYVRLALKYWQPDKKMIFQTVKIGLPAGVQNALIYGSSIVLQRVVNGYGDVMVGAFTAVVQMEALVQEIFNGFGAALMTYTGQNVGAGKIERVHDGVKAVLKICVVAWILIIAVFWLAGAFIMNIFVSDQEIISIASVGIRISSVFMLALGINMQMKNLLNGAGDANFAMIAGGFEIAARIGFVYLLTSIPLIGQWGIFLTTGFTWVTIASVSVIRYKSGVWKRKSLVAVCD